MKNLITLRKTQVKGWVVLDLIYSITMTIFLVALVKNGSLTYLGDPAAKAVLWLLATLIFGFWKFIILITPTIKSFKAKSSLMGALLFSGLFIFSFGLFPFIIALVNNKNEEKIYLVQKSDDFDYDDDAVKRSTKYDEIFDKDSAKKSTAKKSTAKKSTTKVVKKVAAKKGGKVRILLTCASAASTGILANNVKRVCDPKKVEIGALPYPEAIHVFNDYDVLLIAPQAAFKYRDFVKAQGDSVIVKKIPRDVYGRGKGEEILALAEVK